MFAILIHLDISDNISSLRERYLIKKTTWLQRKKQYNEDNPQSELCLQKIKQTWLDGEQKL